MRISREAERHERGSERATTPYSKPKFTPTYVSCPYPVSGKVRVSDLVRTGFISS